jgi:diguanylate cyclase (GGDEF)-like protein
MSKKHVIGYAATVRVRATPFKSWSRWFPALFLLRFLLALRTRGRWVLEVVRARAVTWSASEVRVGRRGVGSTRGHVIKPYVLLLTLVVFAVPTAITFRLNDAGEAGIEAKADLESVMTELRIQDGIEWRVIAGRMPPRDAHNDLVAARGRAAGHLGEAAGLGLSSGAVDRISEITRSYSQNVDEELRLLSLGEKQEALDFDETHVDPAFEQAAAVLESQKGQLDSWAQKSQWFADAGLLLTVLLSLFLVSVIQSRRRWAEVRNHAKQQSEARNRTLIDQSSDLVLVVDRAGRADFLSPSVERLLGLDDPNHLTTAHTAADTGPVDFIAAVDLRDRARLAAVLQTAAPGRMSVCELRITGRHGTSTFDVSVQDLTADPSVGGLVLTGHDVTESLVLQHELEHQVLHDTLTGLPNRALLADRFEQALHGAEREGTSTGVLLLDLDRFKEVNDTFGHHFGDELLRQIGPRLAGVLRGVDTIARLGGDEFAVLLPDVHGVDDATKVAAALLDALAIPFLVEGVDLYVEASVGVVISGKHGQDAITLMQRADIAMYIAKTQHLGVSVYDANVDENSATQLALVGDLRRGLDRGELVLYYQPQVSIGTGEVVGAEALVRWQHPVHGLLFPEEFVPLAERTGLIGPLTRYVLDAALAQARTWLDAGRPLPIPVNLSARNLHDEHFAEQIAELLAARAVPAALLELEVTESAIMIDPARARQTLEQVSALGVRLSIDDFGAGFTSLSQLASLPISEIKIDRWFVMTMADDPSTAVIVRSLIDLGHNLGLTLVAEGVETEKTLTALAGLGCDVAQGYHLSRPITADAFDAWCAERSITPVSPVPPEPTMVPCHRAKQPV